MTERALQKERRYLVTVADDLGCSSSVNEAVAQAHDSGVLTTASLVAGGEAFEEAVLMAGARSRLSVGLHVTLCDARPVLSPSRIPGLVGPDGRMEQSPARAGVRYWRQRHDLLPQIEAEVKAQFERLDEAGIRPSHVDGHHHLHMHPVIFDVVCREASERGIKWVRIPGEPLSAVFGLRSPSRGMLYMEWAVFGILGIYNSRVAAKYGMQSACHVYGLSFTGSLDRKRLLDVLDRSRGTVNEVFSHPDTATESGRQELEALTSDEVRQRLTSLDFVLSGYRELSGL
jgi:hopanoid biosynthesis associated protein HpnK